MKRVAFGLFLGVFLMGGCGDDGEGDRVQYDIVASAPRFVVPGPNLPPEVQPFASNNNVEILLVDGRLFFAWRTAPTHFAGPDTRMVVMSSVDEGQTWDFEHQVFLGNDMREPRLLALNGELQFQFFEAGANPTEFAPQRIWRTVRRGLGEWGDLELVTEADQVLWDFKIRNGVVYRTSYEGGHYDPNDLGSIEVHFDSSTDGINWSPVGGKEYVYRGGVSEVAFEFDADGSIWIVTRNEDGDISGFGSHLCHARADALAEWDCPAQSSPERYDSPEMFRHEDEIYLVARRDLGGPYDEGLENLSFAQQKIKYLIDYSRRPKTSALYRIDRVNRRVEHLFDLPGAGDTAFPSVQQTGPHTFLIANYTSPLDRPHISWIEAQNSDEGTQLYLLELNFQARASGGREPATRTPTPSFVPTPTPTALVDPNSLRVVLEPVFARPGVPLAIEWPTEPGLDGSLVLGDGTTAGINVDTHTFEGVGIFAIDGVIESGTTTLLHGAVARTNTLGYTPTGDFVLKFPVHPLAASVLPGVIPGFYWARGPARLAITIDPTNQANLDFTKVAVANAEATEDGSFVTVPLDLAIELADLEGGASGQLVGLRQAVFRGRVQGDGFVGAIEMEANIVIRDVVDVLIRLANFDETAALGFVSGVFGFDPATPPEDALFRGEFIVSPFPES